MPIAPTSTSATETMMIAASAIKMILKISFFFLTTFIVDPSFYIALK